MAERRMFAKQIIDSDAFLDMPLSTQALYFHLSMRADDDGFVNNPKKIQRTIGASDDDIKILILKKFILAFENGVIVIKHWRINNYLRNDRKRDTIYSEERKKLNIKENGSYTFAQIGIPDDNQLPTKCLPSDNQVTTNCLPSAYQVPTQYSIVEDSIVEDSIGEESIEGKKEKTASRFIPPTLEEVRNYCEERNNNISAEHFIDYYESNGWKVGKNKMKDWKAAIRTWERNEYNKNDKQESKPDILDEILR